jgi:riboflavin kinase/FMN adenylyltransferase
MNFQLYDINGPIDTIPEATAVTVGVFDGVHRGHQQLFSQFSIFNFQFSPLAVTLTAHPSFVLGRRDSEYWLDDPEEHLRLLFEAGMKYVAVLPFTAEAAQMSACGMARLMHERLNMRSLLLGYDSRFGSKQNDDFDRLPQLAAELGFEYRHGEPFLLDGEPVSSSRIRSSLADGRVEDTAALLGRPYSISGKVLHGRGVGHTLGFPTANIDLSQTRKMLPREGVYAVKLSNYIGMANLGPVPTFGVEKPLLEVHLLDFDGDLYNQTVKVEFTHRLRDIVRFETAEALQRQLTIDLEQIKQWS